MFIVIEIQQNNGVVSTLTYQFTELSEALAKYHIILSAAAVSEIDVHTALIIEPTGNTIRVEHFEHGA